ncbi:unnamed protein product, partial [Adineta ricciae]
YTNDEWLHPFGSPKNWYRAYHGTKNAKAEDFSTPDFRVDPKTVCLDAAFSIFRKGFQVARTAAYGPGVYCSPNPLFIDNTFAGIAQINTELGKKSYKVMLHVAVNPEGVCFTTDDNIWVVEKPENIRTYGLLMKEVLT